MREEEADHGRTGETPLYPRIGRLIATYVDSSWLPSIPCLQRTHHQRHPHDISRDDDAQHEREIIESTLAQSRGRRSAPKGVAVRLGLSPSTLDARIQKLNWFKLPLGAKRIHDIPGFPQFHELPTALLFSLTILFNYFTMALRLHFLKVQPLTRSCQEGGGGWHARLNGLSNAAI
jgi:hypothetical protein